MALKSSIFPVIKITTVKDLNYWERLDKLKIMSLQRRREKIAILHIWKIKNQIYPNSIEVKFKKDRRSQADRAVLRPLPKVQMGLVTKIDESFLIRSAKLWNKIPPNLTTITNYSTFKSELHLFLSKLPDRPPLPGYSFANHNSVLDINFPIKID